MTSVFRGQVRQVHHVGAARAAHSPLLSDAVALRSTLLRPQRSRFPDAAFGALAATAALATLVAFVAPIGSSGPVTASVQEQAPAVEQTASLPPSIPVPAVASEPSMLVSPEPAELDTAAVLTPSEEPVAAPAPEPTNSAPSRLAPQPTVTLSAEEIAAHLQKGEERVKAGDLTAARLYFDRVVRCGDPRGAVAMAKTYDPAVVKQLPIIGLKGNEDEAQAWYERAQIMQAAL